MRIAVIDLSQVDADGRSPVMNAIVSDLVGTAPQGFELVETEAAAPGWLWSLEEGFIPPVEQTERAQPVEPE